MSINSCEVGTGWISFHVVFIFASDGKEYHSTVLVVGMSFEFTLYKKIILN